MPSRDARTGRDAPLVALLSRELRALFAAPSLWALWLVGAPLAALALTSALARFADVSRAAAAAHDTSALDPFDAVVVPALAPLSLVITALFPFVVTRVFGADRRSGALVLSVQLGHRPFAIVLAKCAALALAFVLAVLPSLGAIAAFVVAGGHIAGPSLLCALGGAALYAAVVAGIGLVAVAVTDGGAAATLATLAVTVGLGCAELAAAAARASWASSVTSASSLASSAPSSTSLGGSALVAWVAAHTPLAALTDLDAGVVAWRAVIALVVLAAALVLAGAALWEPGAPLERRSLRALVAVIVATGLAALGGNVRASLDVSEAKRNSFPRATAAALAQIGDPIHITVRMHAGDPHLAELERAVLAPLSRCAVVDVERVDVDDSTTPFADRKSRAGLNAYQIGTRARESRAINRDEIVSLLLDLAGVKVPVLVEDAHPGHPFTGTVPLAWPVAALFVVLGATALVVTRRRTA